MNAGRWSAVLVLSLAVAVPLAEGKPASPVSRTPQHAPAFSLSGREGPVVSDSLRGKVVWLDFWASWCGPCRSSFPWLSRMHERFAPQGLVIVAIDLDKSRDDADRFLAKFPAPFTVAFDPEGKVAEAYRVSAMPTSVLVDRDGTILSTHAGFTPKQAAALEARIQEACAR